MVPPTAARTTADARGLGQGEATAVIQGTEDDGQCQSKVVAGDK